MWDRETPDFHWSGRARATAGVTAVLTAGLALIALFIPSPSTEPWRLIATIVRGLAVVFAACFAIAGALYARRRTVEIDVLGVRSTGIARTDFEIHWDDVGQLEIAIWRSPSFGSWVTFRGRDRSKLGLIAPHLEIGKKEGARFTEAARTHAIARGIPVVMTPFEGVGEGDLVRPREPVHPR